MSIWVREFESLLDEVWVPPKPDEASTNWRSSASILDDMSVINQADLAGGAKFMST